MDGPRPPATQDSVFMLCLALGLTGWGLVAIIRRRLNVGFKGTVEGPAAVLLGLVLFSVGIGYFVMLGKFVLFAAK